MIMKGKSDYLLKSILLFGIILFVGLICVTNLFHFNYRMNSDIASDAILARLIWESKQVVPDNWYVANEARIICTPNLAALFFGLTHNMILSTGLSCTVMTILIFFSLFYFGKVTKWSLNETLFWGFLGLMIPCNFIILELMYLFASYYAVHVVILFITLGIYIKNLNKKGKKFRQGWLMICCNFFALLLGLQGVRGILVLYGPMFGIEVIRILYICYCGKRIDRRDIRISLWVVSLLLLSFGGTLFPISVGQGFSRNIRKGFSKLWTVVIPDIGKAIGFNSTNGLGKICLCLLFLLAIYLLADIFWRMCRKDEINPGEWGYLVLCSSPVVSALTVAFTTVESTERYYFLLVYVMAFAVILGMRKLQKISVVTIGIGLTVIVLATINIYTVYAPVLERQEPPRTEAYEVSKYLKESGYDMAYATFENANTMTILSNGAVRVAAVASVEKMDVCKWMTSTDWYVPNVPYEHPTAYIITESEKDFFEKFRDLHQSDIEFDVQIGKYLIYVSDYNFSCLE